jgi:hypothetical protein
MCMFRNTQQHSISKHALLPASAGVPALEIHPGKDTPRVANVADAVPGHHRQMHRCIAASIKVRTRQKATRHLRCSPSETATFASVIYRFAITVVVHPTDAGVVLRKLSSRLTDIIENSDQHSVPRRPRHDANRLRKKSKQLQHTLLAPVKGAKCGKWLRHNMANHMVRQAILVEAGKRRASFTSRRGLLGGRPPWSVITNLLVLEEIRPIVRLWLNASSCVACARPRSN